MQYLTSVGMHIEKWLTVNHVSLDRFYDLIVCKTFQNDFNIENVIILSLNTDTFKIILLWFGYQS